MKYGLLLLLLALKVLHAQASDSFSTQLKSKIWVAGEACVSAEMLGDYRCLPGEWILHVGDEAEEPIIGKLKKSLIHSNSEFEYYQIIPTVPINAEKRFILRSHQLRVSLSGETQVVKVR